MTAELPVKIAIRLLIQKAADRIGFLWNRKAGVEMVLFRDTLITACDCLDPENKTAPFEPQELLNQKDFDSYTCFLMFKKKELCKHIKDYRKE